MSPFELVSRDHPVNYSVPTELCTLQTCSITQAQLTYDPNLGGNLFLAAFFGLLLAIQILLGIYYRTWTYAIGLVGGLTLELCGYIGRIQMHYNPFIQGPFFMYLISLTIGPTFLCASIYICFSRIITIFNPQLSRISPRKIVIIFVLSDFTSLVLQAGGGAIAVVANSFSFEYVGIHLMLAGLALQVFSLCVVLMLGADFAWCCARKGQSWEEHYETIRNRRYFGGFIYGLVIATVTILIRSSFRVAELSGGFHGKLWNDKAAFLGLDGTMIAIASICLTVFHPGLALHGRWGMVKRG